MLISSSVLRDPDQSVAEISHACGSYDHSAMARDFRSAAGMTPCEFHAQH
jgi:AraC-like DNA-binding protein